MSALYLTEADVSELVDISAAIDAVEGAFLQWGHAKADNVPRARASAPGVVLHSMSAAAEYLGLVGWKCYTTTRGGARFLMGLYNADDGSLVALIEADRLGQLRTGAATGVAAEWMAEPDCDELGLIGAGKQAATQLAALAKVRPLKRALVYSRNSDKRHEFCAWMSHDLGIAVEPVDRPQDAVAELPMVVTATTSRQPVLDGAWLAEGAFVAAIGCNWPNRAEIDATTVRRAAVVVCDDVEACRREAGDFRDALEKGAFDWSQAVNLADVVNGRAAGRPRGREGVRLYKSVGLAVEDVALAAEVLRRAREKKVGAPLPF